MEHTGYTEAKRLCDQGETVPRPEEDHGWGCSVRRMAMFFKTLARAVRCVVAIPCVAGMCMACWPTGGDLNAQQSSSNFDSPDIQGNSLRPADLERDRATSPARTASRRPCRSGLTFEATVKSPGRAAPALLDDPDQRHQPRPGRGKLRRYEVAIGLNDDGAANGVRDDETHGETGHDHPRRRVVADLTVRKARCGPSSYFRELHGRSVANRRRAEQMVKT